MNILSVRKSIGLFEDFQASPFCHSFKSIIEMKNSVERWESDTDRSNTKSLTRKNLSHSYIQYCKGSFPKFRQLYLFGLVPLSQHTTRHKASETRSTNFSLKTK
jgi:hypothetical protein